VTGEKNPLERFPVLTDEERTEIEEEMGRYTHSRAACVEALKVIQRHRGWVADEQIADLAPMLGMTRDELDGVATFYSFIFRRPVGRHIISVCDSLSCWLMGYEDVLQALLERLGISFGGTTEDGRFTLLPVSCLGQCDRAPAVMIDGDVHGGLTADKIGPILDGYS
jgi:NADH-quinone oxidoreductase subunit E